MKLVIEIDDETYKSWKEMCGLFNTSNFCLYDSIMNGTPLPKGHGRLIDADAEIKSIEKTMNMSDEKYGAFYRGQIATLRMSPTIIEADKERI